MYNIVVLKSENELNKLLRRQRKTGEEVNILFHSLWDKWCKSTVEKVTEVNNPNGKPLYLVDTFSMPHSTVIFRSTKLPHLVKLTKRRTLSEDYLPRIYKFLGCLDSSKS